VRRGREGDASDGRRTRKNTSLRRTGTIYTILHDRITTKSTSIARRRFERSESGRTGCTRIAVPGNLPATLIVATMITGLR
jgi:hypothetical protein